MFELGQQGRARLARERGGLRLAVQLRTRDQQLRQSSRQVLAQQARQVVPSRSAKQLLPWRRVLAQPRRLQARARTVGRGEMPGDVQRRGPAGSLVREQQVPFARFQELPLAHHRQAHGQRNPGEFCPARVRSQQRNQGRIERQHAVAQRARANSNPRPSLPVLGSESPPVARHTRRARSLRPSSASSSNSVFPPIRRGARRRCESRPPAWPSRARAPPRVRRRLRAGPR